jgi:tetratricopeptide (TPR) repeat protein
LSLVLLAALAVLGVHHQILFNGFINFDDPLYVTQNPLVQRGLTVEGIIWAFTSLHAYNWHPLTWVSHMLDVQLFGLAPAGHHLTSMLLHTANVLLLFALLKRLSHSHWPSVAVAALFALHPLHVESVAWVAERKDLLSGLFWLATLWFYAGYRQSGRTLQYLLALGAFCGGLLSKPMVITLPLVLVLLELWPLRTTTTGVEPNQLPWRRLALITLPFFLLSAASAAITYTAQHQGGAVLYESPLLLNAGNALISYLRYLGKLVWPLGLAVLYPFDPNAVTAAKAAAAAVTLLVVSVGAWRLGRRWPYVALGWFWYLVTLLPVIGFIRIGRHSIADRYTYIPFIGLYIIIAWGWAQMAERYRIPRAATGAAAAVVLLLLGGLTIMQEQRWRSSISLFEHTLTVTENNGTAHKNLGLAYGQIGDGQRASYHGAMGRLLEQQEIAALYPQNADVRYRLGNAYAELGRYREAVAEYSRAITLRPSLAAAHNGLGIAYARLGVMDAARQAFADALQLDPGLAEARSNLKAIQGMDSNKEYP